ncbi:MAG: SEC-C metal-binding domain-containing protein [Sutterella wadsworthensis]
MSSSSSIRTSPSCAKNRGRNDPPCGSGKKFKQCCGKK